MANRISVIIDVVADKATTSLKHFKTSVSEADGAIGKMKAGGKSAMDSLKANASVVGPVVGAAFLKGAQVAINAASDLGESANAMRTTFGSAADGIEELGKDSVESFGLSERAFNEAAVSFSSFASTIAGEGGDVVGTMDDMLTRAADFASVHNLELTDATTKFQSALAGEAEAMRKYGIDVSAAAVTNYLLEEGIVASTSAITEADKVTGRYALLMQGTNKWAGDWANTSDELAGSQKKVAAQVENLAAQFGEELIPVVTELTQELSELIDIASGIKDVAVDIPYLTDAFDLWKKQLDVIINPLGAVRDGVKALGNVRKEVKPLAEGFDFVALAAERAAQDVRDADYAAALASGTYGKLTDATDDAAESTEDLDRNVKELTEAFEDQLDASKDLRDERRDLAGITLDAADAEDDFREAVRKLTETNEDAEASEIDKSRALRDTIRSTDDMVRAQLEASGVIVNSKDGNRQWTKSMMDAAFFMGGELGGEILAHTARVNGIPEEKITEIQALLDKGDVAAARRLMDAELSKAEAQVTVTPVGLEAARARISAILGRNISIGVNTYTPRPGSGGTRYGASGGLVTRPTQALIGEAGPELVLPLNKGPLSGALGASPLSSLGGGGGGNIYLTVNADSLTNGNDVGRKITEALREYQARGGQRLS